MYDEKKKTDSKKERSYQIGYVVDARYISNDAVVFVAAAAAAAATTSGSVFVLFFIHAIRQITCTVFGVRALQRMLDIRFNLFQLHVGRLLYPLAPLENL